MIVRPNPFESVDDGASSTVSRSASSLNPVKFRQRFETGSGKVRSPSTKIGFGIPKGLSELGGTVADSFILHSAFSVRRPFRTGVSQVNEPSSEKVARR